MYAHIRISSSGNGCFSRDDVVNCINKNIRVDRFPTLIVCGFTMIAAIQSLFTGMTLETLRKKDRQDFEMQLLRAKTEKRERLGGI